MRGDAVAGQVADTVPATPLHFTLHSVTGFGSPQPIHEDMWGNLPPFACNIL